MNSLTVSQFHLLISTTYPFPMARTLIASDNLSPLVLIITWFLCIISVLSMVARGATKIISTRSIKSEDYSSLSSLVISWLSPRRVLEFANLNDFLSSFSRLLSPLPSPSEPQMGWANIPPPWALLKSRPIRRWAHLSPIVQIESTLIWIIGYIRCQHTVHK